MADRQVWAFPVLYSPWIDVKIKFLWLATWICLAFDTELLGQRVGGYFGPALNCGSEDELLSSGGASRSLVWR